MKLRKTAGKIALKFQKSKLRWKARNFFVPLEKIKVNKPIFLIGIPGGGLTILSRIIRQNPNVIYISGNNEFFAGPDELCNERHIPKEFALWGAGKLFKKNRVDNLYGQDRYWLCSTNHFIKEYYLSEKNYTKELSQEFTKIIKKYLKAYSYDLDNARFVDKSQLFFIKIGLLNKIFPDAKFVLVTRNPFAICWRVASKDFSNSISKRVMNLPIEQKIDLACEFWKNTYTLALKDLKKIGKGYVLRIEDFLINPLEESKRLFDYLDLDFKENYIPHKKEKFPRGSVNKDKSYPLKTEINKKYLKDLPEKYRQRITDKIGEKLLKKTGYF